MIVIIKTIAWTLGIEYDILLLLIIIHHLAISVLIKTKKGRFKSVWVRLL